MISVCSDDWEIGYQDECDTDKLTGLEDFGLLLRPLGLTEKRLVPDPIAFTEPDPLGSLVYSSADPTRAAAPKGTCVYYKKGFKEVDISQKSMLGIFYFQDYSEDVVVLTPLKHYNSC